jgi:hypothetical protein
LSPRWPLGVAERVQGLLAIADSDRILPRSVGVAPAYALRERALLIRKRQGTSLGAMHELSSKSMKAMAFS